jgi:hypothetical protein
VDATDTVRGVQDPPPAVQVAVPVLVRGAPTAGSKLVAADFAVPEHPAAPEEQSTEAVEVDTADGPEVAAFCPGRVTDGAELARESVEALHPPCLTVHSPLPVEDFARPLSTAASEPLASECAVPEQVAVPAGQLIEPEASETLSNPPDTVGFAAAFCTAVPVVGSVGAAVDRVGWVNRVAEFDCD